MTYAATGALTAEQQQQEQAALDQLPSCYSNAFHRCYVDEQMDAYPNCELFTSVYELTGDDGALETRVQEIPFCAEPAAAATRASLAENPVALAIALAAGVGVGYVVWGRKP